MTAWIYRILIVIACPILAYTQIARDKTGLLIGLLVGVTLVAVELALESINLLTMIFGILGAGVATLLASFIDYLVRQVASDAFYTQWDKYALLRYFAFATLGLVVSVRKFPELDSLDRDILASSRRRGADLKVVDTSSIIDGRVVDICETKFLSGALVVPRFVLNELHGLADSPDNLKRARGRRGLDILARLQENPGIATKIIDRDVPECDEVDAKIVRLAKDLGAKVLTTDFNLNKIAAIEGVLCLNINDLTNALKPVVLPGECMSLFVMKEGKEREQGVGYLDDGTMVIVEDGKRHIGKRVDVQVSSILQTSAGRMIFSRFRAERAA
ncbi:MAG: hypothetical protein A2X36_11670 [Elusimicrobia bacterium GWA2_69_24]|nr:MAG: hypothetical protein A2X36_11670 [Elusimicrobia bacterium GWA2_69_24]HBL17333.1 PIN domain nuclease [Elusimicrobiota bacterium]